MKTVALCVIAICYLANTVSFYQADDGGGRNVYFGNFGWYFEGEE